MPRRSACGSNASEKGTAAGQSSGQRRLNWNHLPNPDSCDGLCRRHLRREPAPTAGGCAPKRPVRNAAGRKISRPASKASVSGLSGMRSPYLRPRCQARVFQKPRHPVLRLRREARISQNPRISASAKFFLAICGLVCDNSPPRTRDSTALHFFSAKQHIEYRGKNGRQNPTHAHWRQS